MTTPIITLDHRNFETMGEALAAKPEHPRVPRHFCDGSDRLKDLLTQKHYNGSPCQSCQNPSKTFWRSLASLKSLPRNLDLGGLWGR